MTNYTEDECFKHNELLENLQKKILDYQKILDKIKASRLKVNSLSSPSGVSKVNNQEGTKKESDGGGGGGGVLYETCGGEEECEGEYEDEHEDGEFDYESDCDEDDHYDDFEGDEDTRACFPCPFCYVEVEIHALCNHLQEEHCFDLKNAVCPLCAANFGKDVIRHFIVQHASSLKRRRKSQKPGLWPGIPATLGRELSSFIGSPTGDRGNAHESAPDPLLSPFLCNASISGTKNVQRDKSSDDETSIAYNLKRTEPRFPNKDEQDTEERRKRVAFVQQLVTSTVF